uniref:FACT complex subunit SSRP1 n=1 Tax=Pyramimonas obovata TaxID=1411642 RepID=A0A7S0RR61_9CHLO|mmetsp:Transcript_4768/g.9720  ORF Transcript_4768/g.9720 Transcript_4768/m.9720 type:complete len:683 (+) Transcript_4768:150-2198(+)
MAEQHQFGSIFLAGKTGTSQGALKIHADGFLWRKTGGGKSVELTNADIKDITYTKVSGGFFLSVSEEGGSTYKFTGFRDQDLSTIRSFIEKSSSKEVVERPLVVHGQNWGEALIQNSMLSFAPPGHHTRTNTTPNVFDVALTDVSAVSAPGKNKVLIEFHMDDTGSAAEKDTLVDISFYVPNTSQVYEAIKDVGEERTAAQVMSDQLKEHADLGGSTDESIATFTDVTCLVPRLKLDVYLGYSILKLQAASNEFKIKYSSIVRLYMLPKPNMPQTVVVLSLDPPIRQGKTFYNHVLLQFPEDEELEIQLDVEEEVLKTKYEGKLHTSYEGRSADVFCKVLKGLSGTKLSKPGAYVSATAKKAIRCSMKADDGYLFPLERCFFYISKPPTLLPYDEIAEVEFERQGASLSLTSAKTFDIRVVMKNDGEHQFRNIQRAEYPNFFAFIQSKGLRINNLAEQQEIAGQGLDLSEDDDDDRPARSRPEIDPTTGEVYNESEDEDFVAEEESDGGEPTDSSSDSEASDASQDKGSGGSDGEGEPKKKRKKEKEEKEKKEKPKKATPTKKQKVNEDGTPVKAKKPKKKKDPNAPKKALSGFMYFSQVNRPKVKEEDPSLGIGGVAKVLGERWKALTTEEKQIYEDMHSKDKERYEKEKKEYAATLAEKADADKAAAGEAAADDADDETD